MALEDFIHKYVFKENTIALIGGWSKSAGALERGASWNVNAGGWRCQAWSSRLLAPMALDVSGVYEPEGLPLFRPRADLANKLVVHCGINVLDNLFLWGKRSRGRRRRRLGGDTRSSAKTIAKNRSGRLGSSAFFVLRKDGGSWGAIRSKRRFLCHRCGHQSEKQSCKNLHLKQTNWESISYLDSHRNS